MNGKKQQDCHNIAGFKKMRDICNFVKDNYMEKEIGQRNGYRIFLLKD